MPRWLFACAALAIFNCDPGCNPSPPDGVFACAETSECPPGMFCADGRCRTGGADAAIDAE